MTSKISKFFKAFRLIAFTLITTATVAVAFPVTAQADDNFQWGPNFDIYDEVGFTITVVKTHPTQQIISVRGSASFNAFKFDKILTVLKNIDPRKEIILDVSGYGGGYVANAEKIAPAIKSICEAKRNKRDPKQSCNITSYVNLNGSCNSACIIPYMAGKKRLACRTSDFGFHSMSFLGISTPTSGSVSMLLENGVFKSWIMKNIRMFDTQKPTFMRPADMVGSNIVTEIDYQCRYTDEVYTSAYEAK